MNSLFLVLFAQKLNFAIVDLERVKKEYVDYKNALNQVREVRLQKERVLDSLKREIDSLKRIYNERRAFLTDEGRYLLETRIIQKEKEYQAMSIQVLRELEVATKEILDPYVQRMFAIIDTIAMRNGYDLVINSSRKDAILYYKSAYDITDIVIQELNKGYAGVVGTQVKFLTVFPLKLITKHPKTRQVMPQVVSIIEAELQSQPQLNLVSNVQAGTLFNPNDPILEDLIKVADVLKLDAFVWGSIDYVDEKFKFTLTIYDAKGNTLITRTFETSEKESEWRQAVQSYAKEMLTKYRRGEYDR